MNYIKETKEAIEAFCVRCKYHMFYRKDSQGRPEPMYAKDFKRLTLQPGTNEYYRAYPKSMKIA